MKNLEESRRRWFDYFYNTLRNSIDADEDLIGYFDMNEFRQQDPDIDLVMRDVIKNLSDMEAEDEPYAKKFFKNLDF